MLNHSCPHASSAQRPQGPRALIGGFTLVELMVVVAITGILTAMAVPMFKNFIARQAVNGHISEVASALRLARAEAIKRGTPVSLCPSSNTESPAPTCLTSADSSKGWATGWLIFSDWGTRGTIDGASDTIIARHSPIGNSGGIIPSTSGFTMTFQPNGIAVGNLAGNFKFIPENGASDTSLQKMMCISAQGNSRLSDTLTCN